MGKIRFLAALSAAKLCGLGLRLLGRNASYLPGKVAVKLCPDFLGRLQRPERIIAVTGTNGKTTVSNMITDILTASGYDVVNNGLGSNIDAGVATTLLSNSSLTGKAKKQTAVLEVDERSSLRIYPHLEPDFIVCTNIMRDSITRNANTDFISYIISSAITPRSRLILNGDDVICSELGSEENEKVFYGVEYRTGGEQHGTELRDLTYCPKCGQELTIDYLRYNHIGRVHCDKCGFRSPDLQYRILDFDRDAGIFTMNQRGQTVSYPMVNDNITNMYNTAAVIAALSEFGLSPEQIRAGLEGLHIVASRFDREVIGDKTVTMQLAKSWNPVACSRAFDYLRCSEGEKKTAIVMIDYMEDHTENVCWLYDCDYSAFSDPSISRIIFGGPRGKDHIVRCLIDGVDQDKIIITDDLYDTVNHVDLGSTDSIFILYDLYLVEESKKVEALLKKRIEEASL